jgi:surface antigen
MTAFHPLLKKVSPLLHVIVRPLVGLIAALLCTAAATAMPTATDAATKLWECVPIARSMSGIAIYGDAYTWWGQAEGKYRRGNAPRKGAVLAFKPYGAMQLGHVAAVSAIVDDRTILVTHANWSPVNGRRGQIERNVKVIDVSDDNDWSRVRVWYAPSGDLGTTSYPVHGFIYPGGKPPFALPAFVAQPVAAPFSPVPTGRLAYLGRLLPKLK